MLSMVFSIETTREECQIDRASYFFEQISTTWEMSLRGAPVRTKQSRPIERAVA
jgi:hypothetical protein